ncbi:kinase-like domain-containing protein [Fimicolochytrium jonesii]|uniref:kinase-like domain-containing protein n=1 Tax=Fimicolochytrium jonesii TaxID=1396493 RepID=UPI0022FEE2A3|nr:kinase-like domain-containing protein [Fimicolochytrium jonesii]KAI8819471.1 kinase-like domain-containing protein [Fimicolochytrium jonesii]
MNGSLTPPHSTAQKPSSSSYPRPRRSKPSLTKRLRPTVLQKAATPVDRFNPEQIMKVPRTGRDLRGCTVAKRWKIVDSIASGGFGDVYRVVDIYSHRSYAMKVEKPKPSRSPLKVEISLLRQYHERVRKQREVAAFPEMVGHGKFTLPGGCDEGDGETEVTYSFLVMGLLGPSLAEVKKRTPGHRFSAKVTAHLATKMLAALRVLHGMGICHRDVKPANFCTAGFDTSLLTSHTHAVEDTLASTGILLIDFGMARRHSHAGTLKPARAGIGFRGTSRYASLRAHSGLDLGPVDDLWSLLYTVIDCLKGGLPWSRLRAEEVEACKRRHHAGEMEEGEENVLEGVPRAVRVLWDYLSGLGYESRIDYGRVDALLEGIGEAGDGVGDEEERWEVGSGDGDGAVAMSASADGPMERTGSPLLPFERDGLLNDGGEVESASQPTSVDTDRRLPNQPSPLALQVESHANDADVAKPALTQHETQTRIPSASASHHSSPHPSTSPDIPQPYPRTRQRTTRPPLSYGRYLASTPAEPYTRVSTVLEDRHAALLPHPGPKADADTMDQIIPLMQGLGCEGKEEAPTLGPPMRPDGQYMPRPPPSAPPDATLFTPKHDGDVFQVSARSLRRIGGTRTAPKWVTHLDPDLITSNHTTPLQTASSSRPMHESTRSHGDG